MTAMWQGMSAVGVAIMHFPNPGGPGYLTQVYVVLQQRFKHLTARSFDYNKQVTKVDISTMRETYKKETDKVMSLFATHARSLCASVPGGPPVPPTTLKLPDALPKSRGGFPKIPPLVLSTGKAPDVQDLRHVFKLFLSAHYSRCLS